MRKGLFVVSALALILLSLSAGVVHGANSWRWNFTDLDWEATHTVTPQLEKAVVIFTFNSLVYNATGTEGTFAVTLGTIDYKVSFFDATNLFKVFAATTLIYTSPTTCNITEVSGVKFDYDGDLLDIWVDGSQVVKNFDITNGNLTTVKFISDAVPEFTSGSVDVAIYANATSAQFGELIGVIIMVSVVSILIGAVKLKRR